ncbi:MAG: T9SS type A sorting domain-containing protein [Chitinophagaceae bacterium]
MRIFYILFLVGLFSFQAIGQTRLDSYTDVKIAKFYPNPAVNQITFSFEKGIEKDKSFKIFNFIGKKVFELQTILPKTIIDLSEFYRGVYIFQLTDKKGKVIESGKFQVAK